MFVMYIIVYCGNRGEDLSNMHGGDFLFSKQEDTFSSFFEV